MRRLGTAFLLSLIGFVACAASNTPEETYVEQDPTAAAEPGGQDETSHGEASDTTEPSGSGGAAGTRPAPSSGGTTAGGSGGATAPAPQQTGTGGAGPSQSGKGLFEAENGSLKGTTVASKRLGYSGSGYVTGFDSEQDAVEFAVPIPTAGAYAVSLGVASPLTGKGADLVVPGHSAVHVPFEKTVEFKEVVAGRYWFEAGTATIRVSQGWGWYDLDYIRVLPASPTGHAYDVPDTLVNSSASTEARSLLRYLRSIYGKKVLSGQYGANGKEGQRIRDITGRLPAVGGFDFLHYSSSQGGGGDGATEAATDWYRNKNGLVTFAWHWFSPAGATGEKSFYADQTTFDLTKALVSGSYENGLLIRDLDRIAHELKKLMQANVPVLWRPLHEADMGAFWWGAKGARPAVELYRLMYDRYTNYHRLNNLIWVWNSESRDWYPGNDVVDILSADVYTGKRDLNPSAATFDRLYSLVGGKKLLAMTENGSIPDVQRMFALDARWSFFCTWYDQFIMSEDYTTNDHLKKTYQHDLVITLDEVPSLPAFR